MRVAEYIVDELIKYGVTDAFGIPGGVILKLLYAMKNRESELSPHLNYHEQAAGFAACGYAQVGGKLGVAYATRGPGIANMITCIAEAYQESLPVLFLTAHGSRPKRGMRFENNQEMDIVDMVSGITKLAANIEKPSEVKDILHKACDIAISGRKGPVLLDFASSIFDKPIGESEEAQAVPLADADGKSGWGDAAVAAIEAMKKMVDSAKRPVILIGDGIRHALNKEQLYGLAEKLRIPVLSSRGAQDLLSGSPYFFGYIGSHGTRYSNFILSKADCIVAIGNRLAFLAGSESFAPLVKQAKILRLDIDEKEFIREIPGADAYEADARTFLHKLQQWVPIAENSDWMETCNRLREELEGCDCTEPVRKLESFLEKMGADKTYVCDVGNNEFWFARAFEKARKPGTVLYSKSYGTLGAALGRAIGAYYAVGDEIVCVMGDQGFQYNLQELQYIAVWGLPIKVVVLNNGISGMILDHERKLFGEHLLHVNEESGYRAPDFQKIVSAYGMDYTTDETVAAKKAKGPVFYEIAIDKAIGLTPNLPKGNPCQDMEPLIERDKYDYLNTL